ncbi:MAG: multifunctional oxoglutarate decarboxylase/oxoglutarate dehydrogenase thiamine pyrophosphate-binding subunit/dihydrolipoyllysine-residue succinyltransferase subunit [Actinobacteria bacterium]|nr:multifunctional oxoglutarate decarboxylase/oxoglutarate dehydrogenase thiamine pyrophosphate-binding subunit/dihydrolipoyllysine-residue succinyltransferase subunit [Actinomycetota bacterium]
MTSTTSEPAQVDGQGAERASARSGDPLEGSVARPAVPAGAFGPNAWLVDDMYEQYRIDPSSVSESWREFFTDYVPGPLGSGTQLPISGQVLAAGDQAKDSKRGSEGYQAPYPGVSGLDASSLQAPQHSQAAYSERVEGSEPVAWSERTASTEDFSRPAALQAPGELVSSIPTAGATVGSTPAPLTVPLEASSTGGDGAVASTQGGEVVVKPLRGSAARVVSNMEASLKVPTATSVRDVPAKLLEINRATLNNHLIRTGGGKVSFTHLIAYAVVKALSEMESMRVVFVDSVTPPSTGLGKTTPGVAYNEHVSLGVAVDVERADGTRMLMVPCIRDADTLDFRSFVLAYEDLVRKVRTGKATADDFAGATVSLTNPGTVGTVHSVPRLMAGQGLIVGVGSLDYPAEYEAADRRVLARLGISKVVTLTSTYDHRVIQGAESGRFLGRVHDLLMGADRFYDEVFTAVGVPYEPVQWHKDVNSLDEDHSKLLKQVHVQTLINMYRVRGHLMADLDPLRAEPPQTHPELDPATYGLTLWDLDREFIADGLAGHDVLTLNEILGVLRAAYCRTMSIEYMHIQDPAQKRWIQEHVEGVSESLDPEEQWHILDRLNAAEAFERFLHTRYVGQKRFGLEGAESAIPLLDTALDEAARCGVVEAVLGMAHRGRLNVLANIVGKSFSEIFREFEGDLDPDTVQGSGDVKYHKGATGKFSGRSGIEIPVSLASNPSHLEAVDPVVEGMARAKQDQIETDELFRVLPVLIHGDAAFAGQGVVAETLNLSGLRGYRTGGTIHLVINNQLGFTTAPEAARSSVYPTDVAKMVQSPIIHVNGDDPEACVRAAKLAVGFREAFHKDVVIDMVCYRRHGHNEGDDPSYTQPRMYALIDARRSVRKLYTETLVRRGDINLEQAEQALEGFSARLQAALDETRAAKPPAPDHLPASPPPAVPLPPIETGVRREILDMVASAVHIPPQGFTLHPKLARQFQARAHLYSEGVVDWSLAEAMAFGSLLAEGTDVRLTGQDTRRGTFSQRHAVLVDYVTGEELVPLAAFSEKLASSGSLPSGEAMSLPSRPGRFLTYDSLLSEYAALGFEYGYAVQAQESLVAWEAQFGDFANGGQIIIDNFLAAAEDKWGQTCGLTLLLPHGYEGQGPEHSSARIERFLTLAAGGNMTLANCTTAAQYFHLLRAQVRRSIRRPLVIFTPKSLLRARFTRSPIADLTSGHFHEVLDDTAWSEMDPVQVERVILCSGKVASDAIAKRDELLASGDPRGRASVIRVEQLYPWPEDAVAAAIASYPNASVVIWLQEEPENMGAWGFVHGRLHSVLRGTRELRHVSRVASGSPATGSAALHNLELEDLLARSFS